MPGNSTPQNLLDELAALKARVRALETAPRATNTSVRDGRLTVLDSASGTQDARSGEPACLDPEAADHSEGARAW